MDKKIVLKTKDIERFLTKTGFILEMEVAEILKKFGYTPELNQDFLDLQGSKAREIDIIAKKQLNRIQINLIIECKQSLRDSWIFICSNKDLPRYYYFVKHVPRILNLKRSKIFDNLHILDYNIPSAQNYIVLDKYKLKASDSLQIKECIYKLPKAVIDVASKNEKDQKNLYFPMGLFSGKIFLAEYKKSLVVKEVDLVLYPLKFGSKFYKRNLSNRLLSARNNIDESLYKFDDLTPRYEIEKIIGIAEEMMGKFQIDFITRKNLENYLKMIDDEVGKISAKKWSYNTKTTLPRLPKAPH